jgi:His-Xaa-Ser system radical SAM maturase HxsC
MHIKIKTKGIHDEYIGKISREATSGPYLFDGISLNDQNIKVKTQIGDLSMLRSGMSTGISLPEGSCDTLIECEDIILVSKNNIKVLFKNKSLHNVIFITENCQNYCMMCSQPPRKIDDSEKQFRINSWLLTMLPPNISSICFTGGEPTLYYDRFISLLEEGISRFPDTIFQILTNGRVFSKNENVKKLNEIDNGNILLCIPLNSDVSYQHDLITQSKNSFNQTLKGLYNLALFDSNIEIRVVITKQNYKRLPSISEFLYRDLPFVSHIAFMGLEYIGLVPYNHDQIWIEPDDYKEELEEAVLILSRWGLNVSVYNIPICLTTPALYPYLKRSISDWKISFDDQCKECALKKECCGLFATSLIKNSRIKPFKYD